MIFLIVVVLLVVAIVLSRLTWASRLGERRSIKHHEQAMDVLRSVAGRPDGPEETEQWAGGEAHIKSSVDHGASFPEPAGGRAAGHREETIRIVRSEPSIWGASGAEPSTVESPTAEPPTIEAPSVEPAFLEAADVEAADVETVGVERTETRPDGLPWEPAAASSSNGQPIGYEPAVERSPLPDPPGLEGQYEPASSRAEARSRSRARTRALLRARVQAPFVAAARAGSEIVSEARARLATRRSVPAGDEGVGAAVGAAESTPDSGGRAPVRTAAAVAAVLRARQAESGDEASAPRASRPRLAGASRPRLVASLATIVVVIGIVAGVLAATMSGSSHKVQQNAVAAAPPPKPAPAPAPPPAPFKLVSSDQSGSVYNVTSTHLALSAVASGRVWMEVVAGAGPSGPVIFQGILSNGQSQQITNDAPIWIRIGAPGNVAMTVNGAGVILPSTTLQPYNLTFST